MRRKENRFKFSKAAGQHLLRYQVQTRGVNLGVYIYKRRRSTSPQIPGSNRGKPRVYIYK